MEGRKESGVVASAQKQELSKAIGHLRMGERCSRKTGGQPERGHESHPQDSEMCLVNVRDCLKSFNHHARSCAKLWDPKWNIVVLTVSLVGELRSHKLRCAAKKKGAQSFMEKVDKEKTITHVS